jgi:DUF971 family protein
MIRPLQIKLKNDSALYIKWEDNTESVISLEKLRRLCPCASCKIEREKQSADYIPIMGQSQVTVKSIKPVGSYAVSISWMDGHSTGIYEYTYLKMLSPEKSAV